MATASRRRDGLEQLLCEPRLDLLGFLRQVLAGAGQVGDVLLELRDPAFGLDQFVEDGDPGHHREPVVADLAETCP